MAGSVLCLADADIFPQADPRHSGPGVSLVAPFPSDGPPLIRLALGWVTQRAGFRSRCRPRSQSDPRLVLDRRSPGRQRAAGRTRGRGSRRALLCTSPRRAREPDCCRPETSSGLAKRKLTLADRLGSVVESLADIVRLEIREGFQDLFGGHAV